MDKGIANLRKEYRNYRDLAHSNNMKSLHLKDIQASRQKADKYVESIQTSGNYENLEQADFYRDKFTELEKSYRKARQEKMKWSEYNPIAQEIFSEKEFVSRNSYLKSKPKDNQVSEQPPVQSRLLNSFFDEKKSKIAPQIGFKSLLQNPPTTNKSFKKKAHSNNEEIQRLRSQNNELRRRLASGEMSAGDFDRIRQHEERIAYLQEQNDMLSRDNERLKSEKSVTTYLDPKFSFQDSLNSPYILNPRENDLYKINVRNESEMGLTNYHRNEFEEDHNNRPTSFSRMQPTVMRDTYSNSGQQSGYSVFDMSRSYYSEQGGMNESKLGIENSRTVGKNKTAFFKTSGILVRQEQFQVAYKRSEPEAFDNYSKVRVVLYFNNKTGIKKSLSLNYDYESDYYDVDVKQKAKDIAPFKQSREVIQVQLKPSAKDLNSVIEANARVEGENFKLWIPAMFIKMERKSNTDYYGQLSTKTVMPHKYFRNSSEAHKVISMGHDERDELEAWGKSRMEEGPIHLRWKRDGKLEVKAPEKWVDFLGFVMLDLR